MRLDLNVLLGVRNAPDTESEKIAQHERLEQGNIADSAQLCSCVLRGTACATNQRTGYNTEHQLMHTASQANEGNPWNYTRMINFYLQYNAGAVTQLHIYAVLSWPYCSINPYQGDKLNDSGLSVCGRSNWP